MLLFKHRRAPEKAFDCSKRNQEGVCLNEGQNLKCMFTLLQDVGQAGKRRRGKLVGADLICNYYIYSECFFLISFFCRL